MMGNARMSIRSHVTAAGALAGAGILTLALVVAPPDSDGARTEVRAVQLTALAVSPAQFRGALEKFISNRIPAVAPVAPVVKGGGGTAPVTVKSTAGPATNTQKVETAALAAAPNPLAISGGIFAPIVAVVGILLLFGPLIVLVILACPICAIVNELSYFLPLPTLPLAAAVPTAMVEAEATSTPELTNEPVMKKVSASLAATEEPAEAPPVTKTRKVDVASPTVSTEPVTEYETLPTAVNESEQAGSESTSAAKPAKQPETPRPVVRDSLDASEQLPDRPHRGKGDHPMGKTAAAVDEAATSESSSAAAPSPKDGGAPKGDADGSE
jgi:hypothetical protein